MKEIKGSTAEMEEHEMTTEGVQIDEEIMHIYRIMNTMFDIEPATVYKEFAEDGAPSKPTKIKK